MNEDRLERIEQLVVQLIEMVGENNRTVKGLELRMDRLEERFDGLEERFDGEKKLNQLRHEELMKEIRNQKFESP